jgi:hypothetical protein
MIHAEPQAVPPRIRTGSPLTLFAGAIFVFVVMCALAFIYFFNPSTHGFYPRCLFHQLTGLNCPGCGSTRALYALLHGQIQTALRDNALFIISLAGGAIWGTRFLVQKRKNPGLELYLSPKFGWGYLVVAVTFTILRNLPAFSFLSP